MSSYRTSLNYYRYTYGFRYLLCFQYLVEDRRNPEFHLRFKHQISLTLFTLPIFSLVLRSYSTGALFIKDKEVNPLI